MATPGPIVSRLEEAGVKIWQGIKGLGGTAQEVVKSGKGALDKGDKYVKGFFDYPHDGTFGGAIMGIAKERPLSSALATTAVVGGTVYGAKKILGPHTQRAVYSANDNERRR
mgnify:CR=1 FL=1